MTPDCSLRQVDRLGRIDAADWDRLAGCGSPFTRHAFLSGLEVHGCLDDHGWIPCHMLVQRDGRVIAAAPLYLRTNSYGEFVFDWSWADAYERAGGHYYPKLVCAIPFTPVCGPRLLVDPQLPDRDRVTDVLVDGILEFCRDNGLSSFHCLFPADADAATLQGHGLLPRKTPQFRWHNRGYRDFDDFLDGLTSKRRKQIRRERRQVEEAGVEILRLTGGEIDDDTWDVFHDFYCSTFHRRWGSPRMTRGFFRSLSRTMPEETLLIMARRGSEWVAGAFAMLGDDTLYGRHWGCAVDLPCLHFELCYYQTIEHCIALGLQCVDAGVQGEHKLNRGFEPVGAPSLHWLRHDGFRDAVRSFLAQETREIDTYVDSMNTHLPFRSESAPRD